MLDRTQVDLWYGTSGPQDAQIVLVGESWGVEEDREKRPFVGTSGVELDRILASSGLDRRKVLTTNVVAARPPQNQTFRFFTPKSGYAAKRIGGLAPSALVASEVSRLYAQISAHPRRLVVATGNYALWALSSLTGAEIIREADGRAIAPDLQTWGPNGIMKHRGSMVFAAAHPEFGHLPSRIPLLPIIHPAAIQRNWAVRDVTLHDLKARVPKALRGDWRPAKPSVFLAPPTFAEATQVLRGWWSKAQSGINFRLSCDIETLKPLITCLGLANSSSFAISIPFVRPLGDGGLESYWSPDEEARIVHLLRLLLSHPNIEVEGQNFIYDTQYIQHYLGVTPHCAHDTMLCQNVLFPGTPKDLGYLSSLYCDYHWFWKEDGKEWDTKIDLPSLLRYNCEDCTRTWEIAEAQRILVSRLKMTSQMSLKMATHHMCLRMMNRGVLIDRRHRDGTLYQLQEAMASLQKELLTIIPQEMVGPTGRRKDGSVIHWYTSDKQTKHLFYEILGFRVVRHRKTGNPTTGKEALRQLRKWYPEFSGLLRRLDTYGSVDNTVQVLRSNLDPDGRMRCSYNPGGTETHRLSSSENVFGRGTNLQNLTKGEEEDAQ